MPLSKTEAAKLTQDLLLRGVIEAIVKESAVFDYLPFMAITGSALKYNREATLGDANFYAPNAEWGESAPTFEQITATLAILGDNADIDAFLQATYASHNDLTAAVIAAKAKAVAHKFMQTFYYGDTTEDENAFNGLVKLVDSAQVVSMGTNGAKLTLAKFDEALDLVAPGRPDLICMSKRTLRELKTLRRAAGVSEEAHVNAFGRRIETYDGIPIAADDFILNTETQGTSTDCTSVWFIQFGMMRGVMGLENGGIVHEDVGPMETKDARRHRIKWYCGLALFRKAALARLKGIRPL